MSGTVSPSSADCESRFFVTDVISIFDMYMSYGWGVRLVKT